MSPTWTTSCTLRSALIVLMNAGVASNSAVRFDTKAGVVSQYGESPYTASVSVFGLLPAEAVAAATASTASTAPSAMNFFMNTSLRSGGLPAYTAKRGSRRGSRSLPAISLIGSCRVLCAVCLVHLDTNYDASNTSFIDLEEGT